MNGWRQAVNIIGKEFFQVALVTYLLLTLAETLREGFVSNFFNMNYLLLVVLVSGVAMVLTEPNEAIIKSFRRRASRGVIVLAIRTHKREQERLRQAAAPTTPQLPPKRPLGPRRRAPRSIDGF